MVSVETLGPLETIGSGRAFGGPAIFALATPGRAGLEPATARLGSVLVLPPTEEFG
jgi:hypothetical protein